MRDAWSDNTALPLLPMGDVVVNASYDAMLKVLLSRAARAFKKRGSSIYPLINHKAI